MAPLLARMDPEESRKAALLEELAGRETASGIDDLKFRPDVLAA